MREKKVLIATVAVDILGCYPTELLMDTPILLLQSAPSQSLFFCSKSKSLSFSILFSSSPPGGPMVALASAKVAGTATNPADSIATAA